MRRRLALVLILALTLVGTVAVVPATGHGQPLFPAQINLPDGWRPEGITAGLGTKVYVGSLANGAIRKVDVLTGRQRTIVPAAGEQAAGKPAVGVEYDFRRNRLWVAGGGSGEVRVYNAATGRHLRTYTFPVPATGSFLNDLVVTRNAVYVTDSMIQELKVIPLGLGGRLTPTTSAHTLPLTGAIQYVPDKFNANGIVAKDGWLILVQSETGELFRVNRRTGVTREIGLGGATVTFGDGLELRGATLYVSRNQLNRIEVLRLGERLRSAKIVGHITRPGLDIPSTIAFQAGRLWAVNARFTTPPTPTTPYWITRLPARP